MLYLITRISRITEQTILFRSCYVLLPLYKFKLFSTYSTNSLFNQKYFCLLFCFSWSVFSRIQTEHREIRSSVQMRQNADQKKLRIWTCFTQCYFDNWFALKLIYQNILNLGRFPKPPITDLLGTLLSNTLIIVFTYEEYTCGIINFVRTETFP